MKKWFKKSIALLTLATITVSFTGCKSFNEGKRIIRISHSQSVEHPDHIGLLAFEQYIEDRLGDKYDVQIYPNELLGASVKACLLYTSDAADEL